jgi:P27 family predicted phage terminase small subunit
VASNTELSPDLPPIPRALSTSSKRWWQAIVGEYEPSHAELRLLETACRAHDRAERCRHLVDREGVTVKDRFGQQKIHPALVEERQQRDLCRRAISNLSFQAEAPE